MTGSYGFIWECPENYLPKSHQTGLDCRGGKIGNWKADRKVDWKAKLESQTEKPNQKADMKARSRSRSREKPNELDTVP